MYSYNLVIVESPAKIKSLSTYLGANYKFCASMGHIKQLSNKEGSVDPDNDFAMEYDYSRSMSVIKQIQSLAKGAGCIYLAMDPDREGEAIAAHIRDLLSKKLKADQKICRISFTSITKNVVLQALKKPRDVDESLVDAQTARRALDYLVGYTLSPILWRKIPGARSAGRVQSVALRMICRRENEIALFVTITYWDLSVVLELTNGEILQAQVIRVGKENFENKRIEDKEIVTRAMRILEANDAYKCVNVTRHQQKRVAYAPFITSTMQQAASAQFRMSPSYTMRVAQQLYEGVSLGSRGVLGLITYMRTDSTHIEAGVTKDIRSFISKEYGDKYLPAKPIVYKKKHASSQEAHECIRAIDVNIKPSDVKRALTPEQYKLYELIWTRTVACQMSSMESQHTSIDFESIDGAVACRSNGVQVKFDGFTKVYPIQHKDIMLPNVEQGDDARQKDAKAVEHQTQPPARYTEASLIKQLEKDGIGRPSTYASILQVLQNRAYMVIEDRKIMPRAHGHLVTLFLEKYFPTIVAYEFTAKMEGQLDEISVGHTMWRDVLRAFWDHLSPPAKAMREKDTREVLEEMSAELPPALFIDDQEEQPKICQKCGKKLHLKVSPSGPFLGCDGYPECSYTKTLGGIDAQVLGEHSTKGGEIRLKSGPYGPYIEWQPSDMDKPKRVSLKSVKMDSITLEKAEQLLSFPVELGEWEGCKINVNIGPYGVYVTDGKISVPVKGDWHNLSVSQIAEMIRAKKEKQEKEYIGQYLEAPVYVRAARGGRFVVVHKNKRMWWPKESGEPTLLADVVEFIRASIEASPAKRTKAGAKAGTKVIKAKPTKKKIARKAVTAGTKAVTKAVTKAGTAGTKVTKAKPTKG